MGVASACACACACVGAGVLVVWWLLGGIVFYSSGEYLDNDPTKRHWLFKEALCTRLLRVAGWLAGARLCTHCAAGCSFVTLSTIGYGDFVPLRTSFFFFFGESPDRAACP